VTYVKEIVPESIRDAVRGMWPARKTKEVIEDGAVREGWGVEEAEEANTASNASMFAARGVWEA
jgi:hypothetical protein